MATIKRNIDPIRDFDSLPDSAEVRVSVVAALNGVSEVTVWRRSRTGQLPKPTRTGGSTTWNVGALRKAKASASAVPA